MTDQLPSDALSRLKARLTRPQDSYVVTVDDNLARALVECAERLKLVIAADDKAVAELVEMGLMPTDSEYFSLVEGNKAAIAKLEAL